ncbi:hypothetical protein Swit_2212 [Rhizorhabdus wittichii RW1]|uniref:Uncharacterized protein n=1 Tax=Rhizorhabdus wittichii (strain DSM 6014 / CCUG 31198 / JCM 15750 / NBRC 105917 / EY 4224 / RW1) TaxID=392499 RepID=A0A9J9LEZ9_RHIWR|nr:hypothetical protein Swit_2212 [Rhizorhabdus wittichii RW1]
MHTLTMWRAKRAGGRMTVYGKDEAGNDTKVVGVDRIERFQPDNGTARITIALIDHTTPSQVYHLAD